MARVADEFSAPKVVLERLPDRSRQLDVFVVDDSLDVVEYESSIKRPLEADHSDEADDH